MHPPPRRRVRVTLLFSSSPRPALLDEPAHKLRVFRVVFAWADYSGSRPIQKPGHVYVIKP